MMTFDISLLNIVKKIVVNVMSAMRNVVCLVILFTSVAHFSTSKRGCWWF